MRVLSFALALITFSTPAFVSAMASTQSITCHFSDSTAKDVVLVTLKSEQNGTFLYQTGEASDPSHSSLPLTRLATSSTSAGQVGFEATAMTPGNAARLSFIFEFPATLLMKAGTRFKADLTTEIRPIQNAGKQPLLCDSKLN